MGLGFGNPREPPGSTMGCERVEGRQTCTRWLARAGVVRASERAKRVSDLLSRIRPQTWAQLSEPASLSPRPAAAWGALRCGRRALGPPYTTYSPNDDPQHTGPPPSATRACSGREGRRKDCYKNFPVEDRGPVLELTPHSPFKGWVGLRPNRTKGSK